MRKDEFPIVDKAIEDAVLQERRKWEDKLDALEKEVHEKEDYIFRVNCLRLIHKHLGRGKND